MASKTTAMQTSTDKLGKAEVLRQVGLSNSKMNSYSKSNQALLLIIRSLLILWVGRK